MYVCHVKRTCSITGPSVYCRIQVTPTTNWGQPIFLCSWETERCRREKDTDRDDVDLGIIPQLRWLTSGLYPHLYLYKGGIGIASFQRSGSFGTVEFLLSVPRSGWSLVGSAESKAYFFDAHVSYGEGVFLRNSIPGIDGGPAIMGGQAYPPPLQHLVSIYKPLRAPRIMQRQASIFKKGQASSPSCKHGAARPRSENWSFSSAHRSSNTSCCVMGAHSSPRTLCGGRAVVAGREGGWKSSEVCIEPHVQQVGKNG